MNEEDLRDCFAMFITCGLVMKYDKVDPEEIWRMADAMLETRKPKDETGIAAVKRTRKTK
jgi:hypothetical protein